MSNLIRGEFYKLRKSNYFIGIIFLAIVTSFFLITVWDKDMQRLQKVHSNFLMNGVFSIQYGFEYIIYTSFIFALLGGEFIAKDFKNNNISKSFSYGYTRSKVILSKLIVFIIACLFLEIIYTTILVIYVSTNHGFCEVLNLSVILYLTRVIIIGIMYSAATICIIAMIAIITKSALCTFVSPVIFLLIQLFFSNMSAYILPYVAGRGAISRFAPKEEIIFGIISSLITFIITIGVSMLYVRHEDIK
ncbi:ABC transporter permease [Clostridium estertheticum]|uniref:ABC transporter permease n=1 Tax=Clostridium estertheticum TaxID=238834 RepID=UPI001CF40CDA|nr:ABC transporter permease [Clostridium estertheticum]MCB2307609.1 ABC transporter permease [Clostridium estertheticum]MCB2346734.1 ABC transporter permease [Clostridium estertheticum]MCB2351099.1 ABC transporter permease [Clostridium estertheticum]WAG46686.1 ABC transporter permease [Clostridium estertheticum]